MSQPVKLSDSLVLDARVIGTAVERSIAGQIEFWARLGRAIEPLLEGHTVMALSQAGGATPLSECFDSADSPAGRLRVSRYLESQPYPHYEPAQDSPGLLARIDADGKRTLGRFVNKTFRTVRRPKKTKIAAKPRSSR